MGCHISTIFRDMEKAELSWILPAYVESFQTRKDRTIAIRIGTNELSPEQQTRLFSTLNTFGFLAFKEDEMKTKEIEILADLESDYEDKRLSPSKRMRNVLYLIWKSQPEGYSDFSKYYEFKMEQFITKLKTRLDLL